MTSGSRGAISTAWLRSRASPASSTSPTQSSSFATPPSRRPATSSSTRSSPRPERVARAIARLNAAGDAWPGPEVATVHTSTYRAFGAPVAGVGGEPAGAKPGDKAGYVVLALHNVVEGQDAAFNDWYDKIHLPELMAHPGVTSGQRGMQSAVQFGPADVDPRYVVVLRISTSDLPTVFDGMLHGGPPSPAIDRPHSYGFTYKAVS